LISPRTCATIAVEHRQSSARGGGEVATEPLMTVEQVADYLAVPVKTVYRWRLAGVGPRGARVGRYVRFRRADVDSWLERQLQKERATGGR
jgi:excisionase family DNA binding protein